MLRNEEMRPSSAQYSSQERRILQIAHRGICEKKQDFKSPSSATDAKECSGVSGELPDAAWLSESLRDSFGSAQDRLFDCALPPSSVELAQDDRRIEISEMLNCFYSTFRR